MKLVTTSKFSFSPLSSQRLKIWRPKFTHKEANKNLPKLSKQARRKTLLNNNYSSGLNNGVVLNKCVGWIFCSSFIGENSCLWKNFESY